MAIQDDVAIEKVRNVMVATAQLQGLLSSLLTFPLVLQSEYAEEYARRAGALLEGEEVDMTDYDAVIDPQLITLKTQLDTLAASVYTVLQTHFEYENPNYPPVSVNNEII